MCGKENDQRLIVTNLLLVYTLFATTLVSFHIREVSSPLYYSNQDLLYGTKLRYNSLNLILIQSRQS